VLTEISKPAFFDIRRAFNEDGSLKQINELDGETAASVAGLEHEKLFEHFAPGPGEARRDHDKDEVCKQAPSA
jgi:phage terminase small subunit